MQYLERVDNRWSQPAVLPAVVPAVRRVGGQAALVEPPAFHTTCTRGPDTMIGAPCPQVLQRHPSPLPSIGSQRLAHCRAAKLSACSRAAGGNRRGSPPLWVASASDGASSVEQAAPPEPVEPCSTGRKIVSVGQGCAWAGKEGGPGQASRVVGGGAAGLLACSRVAGCGAAGRRPSHGAPPPAPAGVCGRCQGPHRGGAQVGGEPAGAQG